MARGRAARDAARLRSLNEPRPIEARADDDGCPVVVRGERVIAVDETWRIDEGWWREWPVSRRYWRLRLEGERTIVVFRDLLARKDEGWFEQRY